jgi:hypothetical protein
VEVWSGASSGARHASIAPRRSHPGWIAGAAELVALAGHRSTTRLHAFLSIERRHKNRLY